MQHIEQQEQQPIFSESSKRQKKIYKFKQYLVQSGCVLHFVKFMLGIRNKQKFDDSVPNQDPLQMFKDYIGAVQIDTSQQDALKKQIQEVIEDNQHMKIQIKKIQEEIAAKKAEKLRIAQQNRLKQQQQTAKNTKKGAKK